MAFPSWSLWRFSYNDLTALPADVFDGLSSLENLDLKLNDLSKLPDGVFDGLSSLEDLLLGGNYLTALPAGVFNGLSNLEYLSLSANDLTELPAGVFNGLSNLEDLKLHTNDLSALPAGVFEGLSSLRSVDLQDNPGAPFTLTVELEQRGDDAFVVKVADGTPSDMTVILAAQGGALSSTTFTIHGGSVTSEEISVTPDDTGQVTIGIESVAFKRSRSYKGIQIGFGNYSLVLGAEVPANTPATGAPTISGTAQVGETLTASTSGIADADGLTGVTYSYQWLSSRDTEIQGATSASYTLRSEDAGKIIKVRVTFTDDGGTEETLTSAPTAVVAATPQGICDRTESVRHAVLGYLPNISDCSEVTAADLSGIRGTFDGRARFLVTQPTRTLKAGDFRGLSAVEVLEISNLQLEELPVGVFDGLSDLEVLRLRSNDLEELPAGVFDGLSNLELLDLEYNDLSTLSDGVFDGLSNLQQLHLMRNNLSELTHDAFDGLANLRQLDLGDNSLGELPDDVFQGLSSLELLNIRDNDLSELPNGVFDDLSNLQTLQLYSNGLSRLPDGVFDSLSNLQTLYLGNNDLTELPKGVFDGLSSLQTLYSHNNSLSRLPDSVFVGLLNLKKLRLRNNPGSSFTITAELEQRADAAFVVEVDEGAPFDIRVTLSAKGGTMSETEVTIDGGSLRSEPITVTRGDGEQTQVTVSVESAAFQRPPKYYDGIRTGLGEPLVLGAAEAVNTPATGAPTISGTERVGETLTADTSGIADADGLNGTTFSYQWLSSRDTEIPGATGDTYTLVDADEGKTVKVLVTFTDDGGHDESLISEPTAAVAGAAQDNSGDGPSLRSYITVVVTADYSDPDNAVTSFTITFNDSRDCSSSYNAYVDSVAGAPIHLGSATLESKRIASSLTNLPGEPGGFHVKLYCGSIDSGRDVSYVWIPGYRPVSGTYSSEPPLTSLTASSGTLTPAFHSHTLDYTVPGVANIDRRITLTTTAKDGYTVVFIQNQNAVTYMKICSFSGHRCTVGYFDPRHWQSPRPTDRCRRRHARFPGGPG